MRKALPVVVFACAAAHAGIIPVVNPSFELGPGAVPLSGSIYSYDTSTLPYGWSVTQGTVEFVPAGYGSFWTVEDGSYSVDLNGTSQGGISQNISGLTAGNSYQLIFGLSANSQMCGSPGSCELQVQIANITQNYFVGGSPMTWTDQTLSFTPTGSTATLTFNSLNGGTGGPAIDNVRISGAVGIPEPASVCLGLLSAGLLVLARLRR